MPACGPSRQVVRTRLASLVARILIHTPPNIADPAWLAGQAQEVGASSGLSVRVRDEVELAREGFGGLVAVGAGSARPPRLVELGWTSPGEGPTRHVVLVGKGISFDSGGLSLKKPDMQVAMKTDMSGAAVVCAVMGALADAGARGAARHRAALPGREPARGVGDPSRGRDHPSRAA